MESRGADRGRFPLALGGGNAPKTGGMDIRDPRVVVQTTLLRDDNLRNYHASLEAVRQQPCHQFYPSPGWYPDMGKLQLTQRTKGIDRTDKMDDNNSNRLRTTQLANMTVATWNIRGINQKMLEIISAFS
jgi:hypothetical protein